MRIGEGRGREDRAAIDLAGVVLLDRAAHDHALVDVAGDGAHVVVARDDAEDRLVVAARHQWLVVLVGLEPMLGEEHARGEIAGIGGGRGVGDLLVLEVRQLLVGAGGLDHGDEVVAAHALRRALGREGNCAGEVDGKAGRAGREAGEMQAAGAHRLDLGRVRLDGVIDNALAGAGGEMVGQRLEDVGIDGGVLDRGVSPDQRRRVLQLRRIGRHVGDQILVGVAIHRVELAAIGAGVLRLCRTGEPEAEEQRGRGGQASQKLGHLRRFSRAMLL